MEEKKNNLHPNDHDILITLNTRWSDFMDKNWPELLERLGKLLDRLDDKADKSDLRELQKQVLKNSENIAVLQDTHQAEKVRKDTVINISKMGWKFWVGLMAIISFTITVSAAI